MKRYYLGCDVSKGYSDFVILDHKRRIVEKGFQLDDTHLGHKKLKSILNSYLERDPESQIYAGFESTGGYENNWHAMIKELSGNVKVVRLNPTGIHYSSKAKMDRNKTDKISAHNIAEYLITHEDKIDYDKHEYYKSAKRHWKYMRMLKKHKAALMNELHSLVYIANPDILTYWKEKVALWVLLLLCKYPSAKKLAQAQVEDVSTIPYISYNMAEKLIKSSQSSVASTDDYEIEFIISSLAFQIIELKKTIDKHMQFIGSLCSDCKEIALLKTIPGISDFSALGLMLEIADINRFKSSKALASFFGVHPVYKESGDGIGGIRMSKQGRKEPRWILFMVSKVAIVCNPLINELYNSYLAKGKSKMCALGIMMHKILRIVYGMLKNNTRFDAEIDRQNRAKHRENSPKKGVPTSRRYQALDVKAPISKRQLKKRSEVSQNSNTIYSGITPASNIIYNKYDNGEIKK